MITIEPEYIIPPLYPLDMKFIPQLASDPLAFAERIYKFVGLRFTQEIRDYITKSSNGKVVQGKYEVS